ncbi:hypothetical protein [Nostoc sp.]|uniref:hypothetical protein n=1 Tax=Nostoc sp. TaxID=1180 RepID=UPI002FFB65D7
MDKASFHTSKKIRGKISELSFSGNEIRQNNQTLAVLTGFNATTLTQNDFISV